MAIEDMGRETMGAMQNALLSLFESPLDSSQVKLGLY